MNTNNIKQMDKKDNVFVSVSGGETSWYMAYLISKHWKNKNLLFGFANTGRERVETLEFNEQCAKHFGINLNWIEAVVHFNKKIGCTHKVVDFNSASRDGLPFEHVIQKYGMPNVAFPHCTRELKANPLKSFADEYFGKNNYYKAIGIRIDEIDRVSENRIKMNLIYPLVQDWPTDKPYINSFWESQPFRLRIKSYEGNCDYCFKKSDRKLMTIRAEEDGSMFQWWHEMEYLYEYNKANRNTESYPPPYRFFRKNKKCSDIDDMSMTSFIRCSDEKYILSDTYDYEMDSSGGCEDSCEPLF